VGFIDQINIGKRNEKAGNQGNKTKSKEGEKVGG
jgi:hypothetical protein